MRSNASEKITTALSRGDLLSISQLAERTGLTTSQVRSAVSRLQSLGTIRSDGKRPASYRLTEG
jgi:DNA-binding IclR family transcriptional regulator